MLRGVPLEPAPLAATVIARAVSAVVAGDDHGEILEFGSGPELRRGVEQDLRALQRLEPACEERNARAVEAEPPPQPGAVVLGKQARVDTGLGDADPVTGRAIQADQVLRLGRARGDEAVRLGGELALCLRPKRVERQPGARLGERQRVKRLHPRDVPRLAELRAPPGRRASSGRGWRDMNVAPTPRGGSWHR